MHLKKHDERTNGEMSVSANFYFKTPLRYAVESSHGLMIDEVENPAIFLYTVLNMFLSPFQGFPS